MSHETPIVPARRRERLGTRYARRERSVGRLPAVIYGHEAEPLHVTLDEKETLAHLRHNTHVLNVQIDGGAPETCLVKDLQFGYLGDNVIHIDLARVDLDEQVEVSVHLMFIGTPEAAKKPGAIVHHDLNELPVRCKVRDIPDEIRVDLSGMGEMLAARQIPLPPGVELAIEPETAVARIELVLEAAAGEAAAVEGAPSQPEVITERKEEEGKEKK